MTRSDFTRPIVNYLWLWTDPKWLVIFAVAYLGGAVLRGLLP
jgi:hypothetical protein